MGQVERQFSNCQRRLDNNMAELKNSAKEGREFAAQCAATQDWLGEMEALLAEKLVISADRNTLMDQVAEFEPIYKEIMSKEHDIIMVLNRGKDVMTRSSKANASNIKKNLDAVEKSWQKVKKISQERQTRLNTCIKKLQDNKEFSMMFKHFDKDKTVKLDLNAFKSCLRALDYDLPMVEEGKPEPDLRNR